MKWRHVGIALMPGFFELTVRLIRKLAATNSEVGTYEIYLGCMPLFVVTVLAFAWLNKDVDKLEKQVADIEELLALTIGPRLADSSKQDRPSV